MRMKTLVVLSALLVSQAAFAATGVEKTLPTNASGLKVANETEIPDGTLKPGSYSIRIADHLADRMLIEIRSVEGSTDEKFLGVRAKNLSTSSPVGPILASGAQGESALRGFSFSKGDVVEFVYPKNDAAALAKASGATVLAIDPASEGMPPAPGLSPEDMKIVTLWMLTPTPVGPDNAKAGIQATRYQAPSSTMSERAEARPPVLPRLPKTASELPLLGIVGLCSFGLALFLSFWRFRVNVI